jgi:acyl-CoA synthetase (AMP-forming)/AMP-acid ligase II
MPGERLAPTLLEHGGDPVALQMIGPRGTLASLRYADLRERALRVAGAIRARGARVVLLSAPNSHELVASLLGVLAAGAKALLLPADFPGAALATAARTTCAALTIARVDDTRAAGLELPVVSEAELVAARGARAAQASDAGAVLLPTSGTTGAARLVQRSERALLALACSASRAFGLERADCVVLAIPLCHSYGLDLLLSTLAVGACAQLHAGFQLGAIRRALREDGGSVFPGVPVMLDALSRGDTLAAPALRRVLSAGSPLPLRVYERFRAVSGISIGQFYGATEFGSVAYNDPALDGFDPLQVGRPIGEARLRIVSPEDDSTAELPSGVTGRIAVAGPTLMDGYQREPSPLRDGFFVTGDLGSLDPRGRLRVVGRSALLIDVGGKKVNPAEVERMLTLHPDVREAVVLPEATRDTVTRLLAIIVPEPGVQPDLEKLRSFAREHLPPHMLPRRIELCDDPPRSPTGKILRAQLAAARARA